MKQRLLIPIVLALGVGQALFAQSPRGNESGAVASHRQVRFSVAPQISQSFGYTEYIMDILATTADGEYVVKSQLEFPLDVIMAGGTVGLHSARDTLYAWSFEGSYFASTTDPGNVMKDHDWETVWRVVDGDTVIHWGEVEKFSYTESRAEMKSSLITGEGFVRVLQRQGFKLDVWGGFCYQKIEQDVIGYEGWQLLRNSSVARKTAVGSTRRAGYYRVIYKTPHLGLRSTFPVGRHAAVSARAASAVVWVSDFDDHLLRNKNATSNVTGRGFISGANLRQEIPTPGKTRPFFELAARFLYFHASGTQTQRWYGDDPLTPDYDDTGNVVRGIPHEINSRQVSIDLRFGLTF